MQKINKVQDEEKKNSPLKPSDHVFCFVHVEDQASFSALSLYLSH